MNSYDKNKFYINKDNIKILENDLILNFGIKEINIIFINLNNAYYINFNKKFGVNLLESYIDNNFSKNIYNYLKDFDRQYLFFPKISKFLKELIFNYDNIQNIKDFNKKLNLELNNNKNKSKLIKI